MVSVWIGLLKRLVPMGWLRKWSLQRGRRGHLRMIAVFRAAPGVTKEKEVKFEPHPHIAGGGRRLMETVERKAHLERNVKHKT